jgi:MFS family permease
MQTVTLDDAAVDDPAVLAPPVPTAPPRDGVWAPARRRLTLGLVMTITLVAFEALAISTVMPVVADDLGGLGLYGWVFAGFFLGNLLGIVVAGQAADRRGTALPFFVGLLLFSAGLCIGGLAPTMGVLVFARVLQGLGAGAIPAIAYASVGRSYPAAIRPRVFAVFSTAWVVPGLIGPASSSAIEHALSWRAVFLALLPFVVIAGVITIPALTGAPETTGGGPDQAAPDRRGPGVVLTLSVAGVLVAISGPPLWVAVPLFLVAVPIAVRTFISLVPPGTLRLEPGMPAAVMVRGILTFAFFGADAFVSLTFHEVRGQETWVAGIALTGATLGWTTAAWIQQHWIHQAGPRRVVATGFACLAVGIAGMVGALGELPLPLCIAAWTTAGFGIGMAYSPLSVTVLGLAEPGREGEASSGIQLADTLGVALGTGLGGAFVALGDAQGWATSSALAIVFPVSCGAAVLGLFAARRLPTTLPG